MRKRQTSWAEDGQRVDHVTADLLRLCDPHLRPRFRSGGASAGKLHVKPASLRIMVVAALAQIGQAVRRRQILESCSVDQQRCWEVPILAVVDSLAIGQRVPRDG